MLILTILLMLLNPSATTKINSQEKFTIKIERGVVECNLIKGKIYVNGEEIGETYENHELRIEPGIYKGTLSYVSAAKKPNVVGPFGTMSEEGDFYLEVSDVKWSDGKIRYGIMFHGGNKPSDSKGCIMLGAVPKDRILPESHTLAKLRRLFYGTEIPVSSPNKRIIIIIVESYN